MLLQELVIAVAKFNDVMLDTVDLRFPKTRNNYKSVPGSDVISAVDIRDTASTQYNDNFNADKTSSNVVVSDIGGNNIETGSVSAIEDETTTTTPATISLSVADDTARMSELTRVATQHVEQGYLTTEQAVAEVLKSHSHKVDNSTDDNTNGASSGLGEWPMVEIMPIPRYVMKLKDSTGNKFFINVCSHIIIPHDTPYVIPFPKDAISSDGSVCIVYDVILSDQDAMNAAAAKDSLIEVC